MGQFLGSYGMTPMAGRMWGWLLICEPPEQTAAEIAEALQASRGAISGTARILAQRRDDPANDRPRRSPRVLQRAAGGARLDARERRRDLPPDARDRRTRPRRDADRPPERARPAPGVPRRHGVRRAGGPARRRGVPAATALAGEHEPAAAGRKDIHDRDHPDRAAHQVLRRRTAASSTSTSRSTRARPSASSARTAPARRRRSGPCSTTSARRAVGPLVFGIETTVDPVAIHRRIGYLPGEFALYDKLTGGQTIEYFANLRGGVDAAYQADLIDRLDIDPSRKFREYSKGNKQKIGLIVALQHRPDLLILDEPTSGLDPLVQQTFYEVIREAKAEGRTIFLSSHILSEVEKTCDRVAIIRDGRLVKVDRVEALRDLAHHQVELRFAGEVPGGRVRGPAGRQRGDDRRPHPADARLGLDHAGRPRGRPLRAARLRQPRAVARGDVPRRVRPRRRPGGLT